MKLCEGAEGVWTLFTGVSSFSVVCGGALVRVHVCTQEASPEVRGARAFSPKREGSFALTVSARAGRPASASKKVSPQLLRNATSTVRRYIHYLGRASAVAQTPRENAPVCRRNSLRLWFTVVARVQRVEKYL